MRPSLVKAVVVATVAGLPGLAVALTQPSYADATGSGSTVSHSVGHAVTGPVRDMPTTHTSSDEPKRTRPLRLVNPGAPGGDATTKRPGGGGGGGSGTGSGADNTGFTAIGGAQFAGVGNGDYNFSPDAAPPDTNGAAGSGLDRANNPVHQYVQWVNEAFAVFDVSNGAPAAPISGPVAGNTLFQGLGGGCEVNNDGDPIVQFDKLARRWVLTQFSVSAASTYGYLQCVAVSDTADAAGSYHTWAFAYGSTDFNDYPKLSVWPGAYYVTYNIFRNGSTYTGPRVCAWDRASMLSGAGIVTEKCANPGASYGPILAGDFDGTTLPSGTDDTFATFTSGALLLWQAHADFSTTANDFSLGTPANLAVAAFTEACNGGTCIPQPKGQLDSLADRLMNRLAYRNIAGVEHLLLNHSVQTPTAAAGVRWYELTRDNNSAPGWAKHQEGTYSPDGTSRWMGSIAMDHAGDIAVGYSASSKSLNPSIRVAGRVVGSASALGLLSTERNVLTGGGYQFGFGLTRWGDYSAMTVDPTDDCTFWYTNEYEKKTGAFQWSTLITSFKFGNCT